MIIMINMIGMLAILALMFSQVERLYNYLDR